MHVLLSLTIWLNIIDFQDICEIVLISFFQYMQFAIQVKNMASMILVVNGLMKGNG